MLRRICLLLVGLFLVGMYLPLLNAIPAQAQPFTSPGMRFGMNAEGPEEGTDYAFVDLIHSSPWNLSGNPANSQGYPTTGSASFWYILVGDPPGLQTYNFYGEGIFDIQFTGNYSTNQNWPYNNTVRGVVPGTWQQTVNSQGITVTTCQVQYNIPPRSPSGWVYDPTYGVQGIPLTWTNVYNINPQNLPNGTPNNFHLTRPGYPAWQPGNSDWPVTSTSYPLFTNEYLKSFAPFCCLRFMDWMNTNGNTGLSWGANGLVNSGPYSWASRIQRGTVCDSNAYEYMAALCNATGCDMWMNVPVQATDDWKTGFANLMANDPNAHLSPWLHIYYEHGNELWNWGFIAWQIVEVWAQADFASYESTKGAWFCHGMEVGKLLMSDVDDMQPIFNGVSPTFGRPMLAGQFVNPASYCGGGLFYIQTFYGPPKNYIYGMAGAPYFGLDPSEFTGSDLTNMKANMTMANQYGIFFCAYEGGQGLAGISGPGDTVDLANQESAAMSNQYYAFVNMWQQNGGDLCNFFTNTSLWGKFGCWGHLPIGSYINDLSDPACVKYNAAAAMNNTYGCNCGNAQPPPPPPAPPPPPPPPPPAPASSTTTSSSSSSSSSPQSNSRYLGNGHWWSPIYGNYSTAPSYAMPRH